MTEGKRPRSFVRIPRRPGPSREAPSPPHEERKSAPPVDASSHLDEGHHSERIVIPRHERAGPTKSPLGVELREVRYGSTARTPYLRVVPRQLSFKSVAPGYISATEIGSRPRGRLERLVHAKKGVVLGSPFATARIAEDCLTKLKALAIFSSDALSSSAYATEEILLILLLAGSTTRHYALPIAGVIALLIVIVTASYRQTIRAYPSGGAAYTVERENLGRGAGLTAGAALLVDYVLTVSVSVAAGIAAVTSAIPGLHDFRVPLGVSAIALITLGNLRGIREAGTLFALPTYFFILSMSTVIVVGIVRVAIGDAPGSLLHEALPERQMLATQGLTLFLLMRAFSSGSAALTGIEAISNGVPAFKSPEVPNARTTMTAMAGILIFLFLGITFLTSRFGFVPEEDETIVSKLGAEVLGRNVLYYAYQVATALVLFLAANTSYADFPRLSAILGKDRYMPRQFTFRGDRLAFSNGILLLAAAASFILIVFGGEVSNLIPLYAVGVFVSFTLSQSGMVRHWLKLREPGWRTSLAINGVGAIGTGIVAIIIAGTKFLSGAWLSILMMAALMLTFSLIRRHYEWFERTLRVDDSSLPMGVPTAV